MKNLFYRNWLVLVPIFCVFFGFALTELLMKEKKLGYEVVDSWSILSTFGKFNVVMAVLVMLYAFAGVLIRDPKQKRK